jgi:putative membrane protein
MHDANNWYYGWGWGWFLWFGFIFLFFSSLGNWGYTYSAHRKSGRWPTGNARAILDERYARGELTREQFSQLKADLAA